jgi:hypothetical protein
MGSLADRIASLEFAVALLAELIHDQGLATRAEIDGMMRSAGTGYTRAATVAKTLSTISHFVEELEERATKGRGPALHVVRADGPVSH